MNDIGADLQRAFDEGYEKGKADRPQGEWIPFRNDLIIRELAAEAVGKFLNEMDISLFGRSGTRLGRDILRNVPVAPSLKWQPISDGKGNPLFEGEYLVQLDDGYIATSYYDGDDWELWQDSGEVIAWMPLPEPYKGDEYERAVEQMEHDMLYEPTYNPEDGSM